VNFGWNTGLQQMLPKRFGRKAVDKKCHPNSVHNFDAWYCQLKFFIGEVQIAQFVSRRNEAMNSSLPKSGVEELFFKLLGTKSRPVVHTFKSRRASIGIFA
jgi:hypothetical protein